MPLEGRRLRIGEALALCYARGFRGARVLTTAVAIMTAESGRYVRAYHVNANGSVDRGLFQINTIHTALSDEDAYKPRPNVDYALRLYRAHGWKPWSVYNSGAYLRYVPTVEAVRLLGRWRSKVPRWEG